MSPETAIPARGQAAGLGISSSVDTNDGPENAAKATVAQSKSPAQGTPFVGGDGKPLPARADPNPTPPHEKSALGDGEPLVTITLGTRIKAGRLKTISIGRRRLVVYASLESLLTTEAEAAS